MMKKLHTVLMAVFLLAACAQLSETNPTAVFQPEAQEQAPAEEEAVFTPSPAPFQFNLPTPGAEPVSGWRPPLYPVPWALSPYDHFYFARPIAADNINWPIADYRYGGVYFAPDIVHTGVDIDADEGTPILAAGPGTVIWAGWGLFSGIENNNDDPYGIAVAIRHDFGYNGKQLYTAYAHMDEVLAVRGQHVQTGDVIGKVGNTGATTGPHVHFEVRLGSNSFFNTLNPELWIAPPQGWGVLTGLILDEDKRTLQLAQIRVSAEDSKRAFVVNTYGSGGAINKDPYYNENFVLGDLPAGIYKVTLLYGEKTQQTWVEIFPGQVTYIKFIGGQGFFSDPPPAPTLEFLPASLPATPRP